MSDAIAREWWKIADSRNGRHLGVAWYGSKENAEKQIAGFVARDGKGGRPDIHHLIPFMVAVLVTDSESGGK